MGDIADYYMDLAMEQEAEYEAERYNIGQRIAQMEKEYSFGILEWNSLSGPIMLTKMTKEHIENTIKFIGRGKESEVSDKWVELLEYELKKR